MENNNCETGKKRKKFPIFMVIGIALIITAAVVIFLYINSDAVRATKKYNKAVSQYNDTMDKYNESISKSSVENLKDCDAPADKLDMVSERREDIKNSIENGNSVTSIKKDTKTINNWIDNLNNAILVSEQLYKPECEWVKKRLDNIEQVNDSGIVTTQEDIVKYMGQDSGCIGIVYFGLDSIDANTVNGDNIISKGTDAGGSVEIFDSLEAARNRCEYLGQFDNTYLYSGSYALVGTMVIRISYKLDSERQLEITNELCKQMSRVKMTASNR